ncbi:hypothetical protein SMGD1_1166 [Sulfurimonas gotlandica GD1]|jgi:hypothetical protein|uniref:Uncharacterized protein n=1 Tax=Sulfurimonas gotlandica (strain DSM 19862 / JCM 16533 / GD1) TaxID=929558 RepID=B6BGQ9_SULGG|nr:hypothetical protein [Sulfurimonas gotlandica]EDZ63310.1 hypothetical protein CBGD1_930 [Sulfurimonas gotlandica GD1]EHP29690.1 hypothetical protein SMGD1_1166 [Sulfurimonas gotlandica GD1]
MQLKFEFTIYNEALDKFELDEREHLFELDDEQTLTFNILKDSDLSLYNWFKESEYFANWIKEEVYPDSIGKKIAIRHINDIDYTRFYFFKITSSDTHYDYFKKLFNIYHEVDWQDREEVGQNILENLMVKRQELIIELKEDVVEDVGSQLNESNSEESEK